MDGSPCAAIAQAVADAEGVDPTDLEYALQDYVEVDGIRHLANHEDSRWTLTFEVPDHEVTVTNDGLVLVDGERETAWKSSPAP